MASHTKKLKAVRNNRDEKIAVARAKKEAKKLRKKEQCDKIIIVK